MKKKFILFLVVAVLPMLSFAQGCITVFSEDGDRFVLILNGVKQNPDPQTNVRVDGLPGDYYSARIIFEDQAKPAISKNIPTKDAGSGQFAEMTYKIKRTKDGELKLRYFSSTPVPVNYNPPPDMFLVHFGQAAAPAAAPVSAPVSSVSRTTTTTTTAPAGVSLGINGGGMNMSVNVNDPVNGGGVNMNVNMGNPNMGNVSQTTTTTTTSYSTTTTTDGGYNDAPPPAAAPAKAGCSYPMDMSTFNAAKNSIKSTSFEETKLSTAKTILNSNCASTDQVVEICKLFGFEASKLEFAKFAYSKTTDPGNYFKVNNVFSFDASKTELNDYISR